MPFSLCHDRQSAYTDVFPPVCTSYDCLFRCTGHTSTSANVDLSLGKASACLFCTSTCLLFAFRFQPNPSPYRPGCWVRCYCSLSDGKTDVGWCILVWRTYARMRMKSPEICNIFSVSSEVCLLLAVTCLYYKQNRDWGTSSPSLSANAFHALIPSSCLCPLCSHMLCFYFQLLSPKAINPDWCSPFWCLPGMPITSGFSGSLGTIAHSSAFAPKMRGCKALCLWAMVSRSYLHAWQCQQASN